MPIAAEPKNLFIEILLSGKERDELVDDERSIFSRDRPDQLSRVVVLAEELAEEVAGEAATQSVVTILESKKADRYARALSALGEKKEWWDDALARKPDQEAEDDEDALATYEPSAEDLLDFLQDEVLPWYAKTILNLKSRSLIREQAFGEAFDAEDIERLSRIEAFLDRKLEKALDRLLQLQERRRARAG